MSTKKTLSLLLWASFIIVVAISLFGCKTRKVAKQSSTTSNEQVNQTEIRAQGNESIKTSDNSTQSKETHTEAKNAEKSNTEFEADSIVTTMDKKGNSKTVIYPKGPVKHTSEGTSNKNVFEQEKYVTDINTEAESKTDIAGSQYQKSRQDSTGSIKSTDAKGSGTEWAHTLPVAGAVVLVIGLVLLFIYFRVKRPSK